MLTDLVQFIYDPTTEKAIRIKYPYVLVASQDCDLDQDYKARQANPAEEGRILQSVLVYQVEEASSLRDDQKNRGINSGIWNSQIKKNKHERYYFLESVPASQESLTTGMPELAIDFTRYFTVPTNEMYRQLHEGCKRRCRLLSPYKEHMQNRIALHISRVGLHYDHYSESGSSLSGGEFAAVVESNAPIDMTQDEVIIAEAENRWWSRLRQRVTSSVSKLFHFMRRQG